MMGLISETAHYAAVLCACHFLQLSPVTEGGWKHFWPEAVSSLALPLFEFEPLTASCRPARLVLGNNPGADWATVGASCSD